MAVADVVVLADELLEVDGRGRALGCGAETPRPDDLLEDRNNDMLECVGDVGAERGVSQLADLPRHVDGAQCAAALLRRAAEVNPLGLSL